MSECLSSLFGVTRLDCSCFGDASVGRDATNLYFLEDVINIKLAEWTECGDGSMWTRLVNTKERAIQNFKIDFDEFLRNSYIAMNNWNGYLGEPIMRDYTTSSAFRGFQITCKNVIGSSLKFSKVELYSEVSGNFELTIKSSDETVLKTFNITIEAGEINKWVTKTIDAIELPLYNQYEDEPKYFIYWNNTQSGINKRICPTCSGKLPYDSYYTISGIHSDVEGTWQYNEYQHGIRIPVDTTCSADFAFCNASEMGKAHLAVALAHRWAIDIIDDILRDPEPNKWTMLGLEELAVLRKHLIDKTPGDFGPYYSNIRGAAAHLNFGGCFKCSPTIGRQFIQR